MLEGIEIFFNALKEKCSNEKEYAAEILKARGFLLEDEGLILSDNSHRDDVTYLRELLKEENLGKIRVNKIYINRGANVEKIFYKDNLISEVATSNGESWKMFVHDSFAPKVPVRFLEPFVARYVKAINACGARTCGSCDGNHRTRGNSQRLYVDCVYPSDILHEIIRKRLLAERFNLNWNCSHGYSEIIFDKTNKWETYIEVNRAAEFLYNNRIKIRQIRREAADGISVSMARHLSHEELANIFSERANRLFDDFLKEL